MSPHWLQLPPTQQQHRNSCNLKYRVWWLWTSSWCTHQIRAVTCNSSQISKIDYNKRRQLKNSRQQLSAWTCQRSACWGSLVGPSKGCGVCAGVCKTTCKHQVVQRTHNEISYNKAKQSCFLTKLEFICKRKEERAQLPWNTVHL